MSIFKVMALCVTVGGCAAQANTAAEDPEVWGRVDCVRAEGNPIATQQFEQARAICLGRSQAAGIQTSAGMPSGGRTIGDAIGNGIVAGITAAQVSNATAMSCMGENGYIKRPRSQHIAACEAIQAQQEKMAAAAAAEAAAATRKKPSARPKPVAPAVEKPST